MWWQYIDLRVKYLSLLSNFHNSWIFGHVFEKFSISNFTKIRPVVSCRRTDGRTDMNITVAFRNFPNVSKTRGCYWLHERLPDSQGGLSSIEFVTVSLPKQFVTVDAEMWNIILDSYIIARGIYYVPPSWKICPENGHLHLRPPSPHFRRSSCDTTNSNKYESHKEMGVTSDWWESKLN